MRVRSFVRSSPAVFNDATPTRAAAAAANLANNYPLSAAAAAAAAGAGCGDERKSQVAREHRRVAVNRITSASLHAVQCHP